MSICSNVYKDSGLIEISFEEFNHKICSYKWLIIHQSGCPLHFLLNCIFCFSCFVKLQHSDMKFYCLHGWNFELMSGQLTAQHLARRPLAWQITRLASPFWQSTKLRTNCTLFPLRQKLHTSGAASWIRLPINLCRAGNSCTEYWRLNTNALLPL